MGAETTALRAWSCDCVCLSSTVVLVPDNQTVFESRIEANLLLYQSAPTEFTHDFMLSTFHICLILWFLC